MYAIKRPMTGLFLVEVKRGAGGALFSVWGDVGAAMRFAERAEAEEWIDEMGRARWSWANACLVVEVEQVTLWREVTAA